MVLTAHQPVYLGWLGLFHKIALCDQFVFYDDVQYQPKDFNNRNRIKLPNGKHWLTVPVQRKGYLVRTYPEMKIDGDGWRRKHWGTLKQAYQKAPYWDKYSPWFNALYSMPWFLLCQLNYNILRYLMRRLGIERPVVHLSSLDIPGEKSERVLNLCLELGADTYIFGAQGRDYADVGAFEKAGVRVIFQEYKHPVYDQMYGDFVSHLSVVDLLFNHGPDSLEILMSGNLSKEEL